MFTKIIPVSWYWRWIGRFVSLKFCFHFSHETEDPLSINVRACDEAEASDPLIINLPARREMVVSFYFPPETVSLELSATHPFDCSIGLTHLALVKQALSFHEMSGFSLAALKEHWRKIDSLGGKLWVGRALPLRKNRVNWVLKHLRRRRPPLLSARAPEISVLPYMAERLALIDAVKAVDGDFVILLHEKDRLVPQAIALLREGLSQNRHAVMVYSDHAVINAAGEIVDVALKPSWNRLFQYDSGYIGRAVALRREQLLLALEASPAAVVDHRLLIEMVAAWVPEIMVSHVAKACFLCDEAVARGQRPAFPLSKGQPLVSAVIPTRNGHDMLVKAVEAVDHGVYRPVEIIIIDHGSTDPKTLEFLAEFAKRPDCTVIRDDGEFNFSRLMNRGFAAAKGPLLLSLNNDVEMINPDWLCELVRIASLPSIGVVGARLLYPDGTIQHAGFMPDTVNDHWYRFAPPDWGGFGDILKYRHLTLAVTGAVMLITREAWEKAGPFNASDFPVAFNDIDFCLKVREAGFDIGYSPYATLYHKESVTRGHDVTPAQKARQLGEFQAFRRRWGRRMRSDILLSPYAVKQMWPMLGKRV